ncbi:MAG: PQQ-dependent sugar dehydrogenase, partial [Dehalococcoidales bacterium]
MALPASRFLLVIPAALVAAVVAVVLLARVGVEPAAEVPAAVRLDVVADGFAAPVALVAAADGSGRLFVVDQIGVISVLTTDGRVLDEPFLDIRDRLIDLNASYDERGLLGMAPHPDFASNGRFFVYYSAPLRPGAPDGWDHTSRVSEFTVSAASPDVADPVSERTILEVDQPQPNHNAGQLAFGPAGYLHIALGDGGRSGDTGRGHPPAGNGQDTSTLLGSILRIDIDGGDPYAIPADNP